MCHQQPLALQKLEMSLKPRDGGRGRCGSINARKWCKRIVLPLGERCFSDTTGSCSVARCGGEYTPVPAACVASEAPHPGAAMAAAAGGEAACQGEAAGGRRPLPLPSAPSSQARALRGEKGPGHA